MYQYLIACSATDEKDQWAIFSLAVVLKHQIKTIKDVYEVQPIVQEIAEQYFKVKYKSLFILMFHELEEEKDDRSTETDTTK